MLDIFPDENIAFIQSCLRDPAFDGSGESLIAALLEGTIPPHLQSLHTGPSSFGQAPEQPAYEQRAYELSLLENRKNAFDDDPMDYSLLTKGKKRYILFIRS